MELFQTGFAYSCIGLTKDLKRGISISGVLKEKFFHILYEVIVAFLTVSFMCSLKCSKGSILTPRSFSILDTSNLVLLILCNMPTLLYHNKN